MSQPVLATTGTATITTISMDDIQAAAQSAGQRSQSAGQGVTLRNNLTRKKDVLALKLKQRRSREELVNQGIMPPLKTSPALYESRQRLARAQVGDHLQRKIRMRPDRNELVKHHILEDTTVEPFVHNNQMRLKRARLSSDLNEKIKNRPGPLELIEGNILKTEPEVEDAVKNGDVPFIKTNSMDVGDVDVFTDDLQDSSNDIVLPTQSSTVPPITATFGMIPSPPDLGPLLDKVHPEMDQPPPQEMKYELPQQHVFSWSTNNNPTFNFSASPSTVTNTFNKIPQVATQPQQQPDTQSTQTMKITQAKQVKKNKPKKPKHKEIKFHEYKPPNEQANKKEPEPALDSSYNVLLQQQQLLLQLQLQLHQQSQGQFILPSSANGVLPPTTANAILQGQQHCTPQQVASLAIATSPDPVSVISNATPSTASSGSNVTTTYSTQQKGRRHNSLEDLKVPELRAELKSRGLPVSGTKQQLLERLKTAKRKVSSVSSPEPSPSSVMSPDMSGMHKVASSPDMVTEDSLGSITTSASASLSSPPISPSTSELNCSMTIPASPMSLADPLSPPQVLNTSHNSSQHPLAGITSPVKVSAPTQNVILAAQPAVTSPPLTLSIASPETSIPTTVSSAPMDIDSSSNSGEMMDYGDPQKSNYLLQQQRMLIGHLQAQLQTTQRQLQEREKQMKRLELGGQPSQQTTTTQQQQQHLGQQPPPPPPPPPPPAINILVNPQQHAPSPTLRHQAPPVPNLFGEEKPAQQVPDVRSQELEDLLEILIQNGYKPPSTPKATEAHHVPSVAVTTSPLASNTFQGTVTATTGSGSTTVLFASVPVTLSASPQTIPSSTIVVGHPVSLAPNGPVVTGTSGTIATTATTTTTATSSLNRQAPPALKITTEINAHARGDMLTNSFPQHRLIKELPMDIDSGDPSLASSDLINHDKDMLDLQMNNAVDLPKVKIEHSESDSNLNSHCQHSTFGNQSSIDSDLEWLSLINAAGTGLTPVTSTAPITNFSVDSGIGTPGFGGDPFNLNFFDLSDVSTPTELHHLEGDGLDNIPID